jgi:hypothetical protein
MMSRMLMNALVAGLSFLAHAMRDALTFSPLVCSLSLSLGVFPMVAFMAQECAMWLDWIEGGIRALCSWEGDLDR